MKGSGRDSYVASVPRRGYEPYVFHRPNHNKEACALAKFLLPAVLRFGCRITEVSIQASELERLKALSGAGFLWRGTRV